MTEGATNLPDTGIEALKLRALDGEDLDVLSARLQDAIVPICDMAFLPAEHRFVFVANRFLWESVARHEAADDAQKPVYLRRNCGVRFETVSAVRRRGIDLRDRERMLQLLAIRWHEDTVLIEFSGNATLQLDVEKLHCFAEDIGDPWPTTRRPMHRFEDEGETS